MSCSFFQWYDLDPKLRNTYEILRLMRRPNESDASSNNQSMRVSRRFPQEANRTENNVNADSDIIWKIMVFLLVGILIGLWIK